MKISEFAIAMFILFSGKDKKKPFVDKFFHFSIAKKKSLLVVGWLDVGKVISNFNKRSYEIKCGMGGNPFRNRVVVRIGEKHAQL